jgi:DNA polymerase II small subunit/DNA polymerase delta subunit B
MATIDIWLFGKPEREMDFDKATPQDIKDLGENLRDRLGRISEIVEKLENNGWHRSVGLYNLHLYKDIKKELVGEELEKLGIGEKEISIEDFGEEDESIKEEEHIVG